MENIVVEGTQFISSCYGSKIKTNMSDVRYQQWPSKTAKKKSSSRPSLKTLPPTTESFREHVKRAHFQVAVWKSTTMADPPKLDPVNFG